MYNLVKVEKSLAEIAQGIRDLVEQLELINCPSEDQELYRWHFHRKKRIKCIENYIEYLTRENMQEDLEYYQEELARVRQETHKSMD